MTSVTRVTTAMLRSMLRAALVAMTIAACNGAPNDARTPVSTIAIGSASSSATTPAAAPTPITSTSDDPLLDAVGSPRLSQREREEWGTYMTELTAPCANVATSVAQCVLEKRACADCAVAARFLLHEVREGRARERVEADYKRRFDPSTLRSIPIDGSPTLGPADARVTVVIFSDFECPACGSIAPKIHERQTKSGAFRLVYKFVALTQHTHAEPAARAAIAAGAQGKFWEMHDALFANQNALDQRDLEGYARGLKLDMKRFLADMKSQATTARFEADAALWRALDVNHTPTIFVNGREIEDTSEIDEAK